MIQSAAAPSVSQDVPFPPPDRSIKLSPWSHQKLADAKGTVRSRFQVEGEGPEELLYTWNTLSGETFREVALLLPPPTGCFRIVLVRDVEGGKELVEESRQ